MCLIQKALHKEEEDKIINDYGNCENHSYEKKQFWEHKCEKICYFYGTNATHGNFSMKRIFYTL